MNHRHESRYYDVGEFRVNICKWWLKAPHQKINWNYYVYLYEENSQFKQGTPLKEVENICDDFGEFHGGITYCRRIINISNDAPIKKWQMDTYYYKVGCDYSHLCDEGMEYDWDDVYFDAKNTVNKLLEAGVLKSPSAIKAEEKEKK